MSVDFSSSLLLSTAGVSEQAENVPLLPVHLEAFLPELQSLISYFRLSHDTRRLGTAADEMELFVVVGLVLMDYDTTHAQITSSSSVPTARV